MSRHPGAIRLSHARIPNGNARRLRLIKVHRHEVRGRSEFTWIEFLARAGPYFLCDGTPSCEPVGG